MNLLVWVRGLQGRIRPIKLASRLKVGNVRSVEAARQPRLNQEKSSWSLRGSHQPAVVIPPIRLGEGASTLPPP